MSPVNHSLICGTETKWRIGSAKTKSNHKSFSIILLSLLFSTENTIHIVFSMAHSSQFHAFSYQQRCLNLSNDFVLLIYCPYFIGFLAHILSLSTLVTTIIRHHLVLLSCRFFVGFLFSHHGIRGNCACSSVWNVDEKILK